MAKCEVKVSVIVSLEKPRVFSLRFGLAKLLARLLIIVFPSATCDVVASTCISGEGKEKPVIIYKRNKLEQDESDWIVDNKIDGDNGIITIGTDEPIS